MGSFIGTLNENINEFSSRKQHDYNLQYLWKSHHPYNSKIKVAVLIYRSLKDLVESNLNSKFYNKNFNYEKFSKDEKLIEKIIFSENGLLKSISKFYKD